MPTSARPRLFPRTPGTLALNVALQRLREEQGITLRELARQTEFSPASVSGFETNRAMSVETVARILGFLRPKRSVYNRLLELAHEAPHSTFVEQCGPWQQSLTLAYEERSASITEWSPRLIPEVLRAPGYVRTLLASTISSPELLDRQMFAQLCRPDALAADSDMPCRHTFVLSEAALRPVAVDAVDLLEQLRHLQVVGRNHLIALRLVSEGEWWPDLTSARALYVLDKTHAVAVLSHGDVNIYLSKSSDVEQQMAIFDAIAGKALDRQDTRAAISAMIEELESVISAARPVGKAAPMADSHATVPGEATCL